MGLGQNPKKRAIGKIKQRFCLNFFGYLTIVHFLAKWPLNDQGIPKILWGGFTVSERMKKNPY